MNCLREMIIYDELLKEHLNPATMYEWLLAAQADDGTKRLLLKGKISQKQTTRLGHRYLMRQKARKSLAFLDNVRKVVYKLE
jgi:hypothetical protein